MKTNWLDSLSDNTFQWKLQKEWPTTWTYYYSVGVNNFKQREGINIRLVIVIGIIVTLILLVI